MICATRRVWPVLLLVWFVPAVALAQPDDATSDKARNILRLTVDAAAEPRPALKHRFTTDFYDSRPGDAALFYHRAILLWSQLPAESRNDPFQGPDNWLATPLDDLPMDEIKPWLDKLDGVFAELELARACELCEWGLDARMREEPGPGIFYTPLPEIQETRALARVICVRARVEVAEGRFDDAVRTLHLGYKLGRDVAKSHWLISQLVGVAICGVTTGVGQELVARPGAPNLYWALADLPSPVVDTRTSVAVELETPLRIFPLLRDAETGVRSPEQWRQAFADTFEEMQGLSGRPRRTPPAVAALVTATVMTQAYPDAKRDLLASGMDPQRVDAMPVGQVVAIYTQRELRRVSHEYSKWLRMPFWQVNEKMETATQRLTTGQYDGPLAVLPIAVTLMPAVRQAVQAGIRCDRAVRGLQAVEAIRMHAAANEGRLPNSLDDIAIVPVPLDPQTGQPFPYYVENGVGILVAGTRDPQNYGHTYYVTIRPQE